MSERRLLSPSVLDVFFLIQIVANIIVLCAVIGLLIYGFHRSTVQNEQQLAAIQRQNEVQLCAQHDITIAVRHIGEALGLPVSNILVPDVSALDCP